MAKMTDTDEDEVVRLTDIDTREVSLVNRAANKRTFLVVKSQQEGDMDNKVTIEVGTIAARVAQHREDCQKLSLLLKSADISVGGHDDDSGIDSFAKQMIAKASSLKSFAGQPGIVLTFDDPAGSVTKSFKESAEKVFKEVDSRLEKIEKQLGTSEILETSEKDSIVKVANLLGEFAIAKSVVLQKMVATDESVKESINKVAKEAALSDVVSQFSSSVDQSVPHAVFAEINKAMADSIETDDSEISKVVEVMKAAQYYVAHYYNGAGKVVLETESEKVSEHETYEAAKHEALRLNMQSLLAEMNKGDKKEEEKADLSTSDMAEEGGLKKPSQGGQDEEEETTKEAYRGYVVRKEGEKYVLYDPNTKVVKEYDSLEEAEEEKVRLNKEMQEEETPKAEDSDSSEVEKAGAKMKATRLMQMKSLVKMMRDGLKKAREGSADTSLLESAVKQLRKLIKELMPAAKAEDKVKKSTTEDEVELRKALQEKADEAARLKRELRRQRNRRCAPSASPSGVEKVRKSTPKAGQGRHVWPMDLAEKRAKNHC